MIANGLGLTAFRTSMPGLIAGTPQGEGRDYPYRCALLPQNNTVTIGVFGADADSVTISITLPSGVVVPVTVTRASAVPVDDTAAAAALVLAINAAGSLRGHVVASSAAAVITLTFQHPNVVYGVATSVVAATATVAQTQAPGGTAIPVGRFVQRGTVVGQPPPSRGAPALAALTALTTAAQISGVTMRRNMLPNGESALASADDVVPIGKMADVRSEGPIAMLNSGGGTAQAGGQVHVVISEAGGDSIGEARASAAGATAEVWTMTPTAAELDFLLEVEWTQPDGTVQRTPLVSTGPDGSASQTEISDGFRTSLAQAQADGRLTGFVGSGTSTFILTGPTGQSFVVTNVGEGAVAAVETTPAVPYTVPLPLTRAVWVDEVPEGSVGIVMLRLV